MEKLLINNTVVNPVAVSIVSTTMMLDPTNNIPKSHNLKSYLRNNRHDKS